MLKNIVNVVGSDLGGRIVERMEELDNGKPIMVVDLHPLFYVPEDVRTVILTVVTTAIG